MSGIEKPCLFAGNSPVQLHCMLPLEITKYFTSLISLIFTDRDAAVKGGGASPTGG